MFRWQRSSCRKFGARSF